MALLSVSDVLLFFTLIMNSIAISKPRGGILLSRSPDYSGGETTDEEGGLQDTDPLMGPSLATSSRSAQDSSVLGGFIERASSLLLAFRRLGVFIAVWNVVLMLSMIFILP